MHFRLTTIGRYKNRKSSDIATNCCIQTKGTIPFFRSIEVSRKRRMSVRNQATSVHVSQYEIRLPHFTSVSRTTSGSENPRWTPKSSRQFAYFYKYIKSCGQQSLLRSLNLATVTALLALFRGQRISLFTSTSTRDLMNQAANSSLPFLRFIHTSPHIKTNIYILIRA